MSTTRTIPIAPNTATLEELKQAFEMQKAFAPQAGQSSLKERRAKLKKLADYMVNNQSAIQAAIQKDLKKHPVETALTEILTSIQEAKYTSRKLKKWMKPKRVRMNLLMAGTSSYIKYEPKGTSLIISPWNYPFSLAIHPLISAIAAGNVAIIKPSEMTPNTSALLKNMVAELFDPREVTLFEGDYRIAQGLLELPFNHIFFTGSPAVGKIVMAAAAKNLSSVTLELGGKSPAVIDETAKIKDSAEKIAWGKCVNNGQTCIAPDYVLVHESKKAAFVEAFGKAVEKMYGDPTTSESYCRIVNSKHYDRINALMSDAIEKGANIAFGGQTNAEENFIAPTVLTEVHNDMAIMEEEIFGPILPVISWKEKSEVIAAINSRPKPLAMYTFSRNQKNVKHFMDHTRAGDSAVNEVLSHYSHPELPFGGVNNSGIGKSTGHAGFLEFSHQRSVLRQVYGSLKPFYPPYGPKIQKLLNWAYKLA